MHRETFQSILSMLVFSWAINFEVNWRNLNSKCSWGYWQHVWLIMTHESILRMVIARFWSSEWGTWEFEGKVVSSPPTLVYFLPWQSRLYGFFIYLFIYYLPYFFLSWQPILAFSYICFPVICHHSIQNCVFISLKVHDVSYSLIKPDHCGHWKDLFFLVALTVITSVKLDLRRLQNLHIQPIPVEIVIWPCPYSHLFTFFFSQLYF